MTSDPRRDDRDWVDLLTSIAGALGLNTIRVRWKLEGLRKRYHAARFRAGEQVEHIGYRHKICPSCGRLNDEEAATCVRCGAAVGGRRWHVLQRLGLSVPSFVSVSSLLGTAMVLVYGRLLLAAGEGEGIMSFDVATLLHFGGNWAPAVFQGGEVWRLGTAIFLHAGLWHLGFNLLALSQVGPVIEEIFGRGRMLLFFMVTGLLASLGSALAGGSLWLLIFGVFAGFGGGVSIGASGAVMGLIGLAAGWGQRDGTTIGRQTRNQMLKWTVYVLIFGFFIGADNVAHVVGLISGGVIGLVVPPRALARSLNAPVIVTQTILGAGAALASVVLCLAPPSSQADEALARRSQLAGGGLSMEAEAARICERVDAGRYDVAWYETPMIPFTGASEASRRANLDDFCRSRRDAEASCRRFREGGLEGVLGDSAGGMTEERRRLILQSWTAACGEPSRREPTPPPSPETPPPDGGSGAPAEVDASLPPE